MSKTTTGEPTRSFCAERCASRGSVYRRRGRSVEKRILSLCMAQRICARDRPTRPIQHQSPAHIIPFRHAKARTPKRCTIRGGHKHYYRDVLRMCLRCASINPSRTRHEPVIARILAKKCIYLLRMCIFFCTFAAQNTNTLSYEKDFRYRLRACQ